MTESKADRRIRLAEGIATFFVCAPRNGFEGMPQIARSAIERADELIRELDKLRPVAEPASVERRALELAADAVQERADMADARVAANVGGDGLLQIACQIAAAHLVDVATDLRERAAKATT